MKRMRECASVLYETKQNQTKQAETSKIIRRKLETLIETKGTFHSTKTFENLETEANCIENSQESFQKFHKLLKFWYAHHSTKNSRNSEKKVECKENFREKVSENLVIPRKVVLFLKLLENAVQFSTGSCRKCKPDFLVEWKAPKVTKQIEVIHSVLTESLITAWQSRNGNENFLTWNNKFRADQTDRSKRTTCGSGPLWPQAAQQCTLFIFTHSLINSKSNKLHRVWAACALTRKFPHERKHSIYFSTEISETFGTMERTLGVDQKKKGTGSSYHRKWILQLRL